MANYTVTDIQKAYIAFFGRPGEPAGVDAWLSVANVTTLDHLYANFAAATEYRDYYAPYINGAGTITNIPGLLNQVYLNLFGRGVEEAGVTYWSPLLASGAITINNVVIELLNGAKNADLISVNSKLDAATAFTAAVRAAAYMGYDGPADAVIAHAWLSGVHDAASKSAAIATLPATIAVIVDINDLGEQYDLTSAADTVNGTTGDDTIIATNSTLTAGDRIHGGLPTASDVVKYYTNVDASHAAFEMDGVERFQVTADQKSTVDFDFSGSTGITTVASYNSTGNVAFNQLQEIPLVVEVQRVTQTGDVTVEIQDAAVAGKFDEITLNLINNYNAGVGVITIGSVSDANSGIEILNVVTSVAASTVEAINVDMKELYIAGDKSLVVTNALNGTERIIDASAMTTTANLTLESTNTGSAAVSFIGSQGIDTVTFEGTTGDHTINAGTGNDIITLGLGDDTVDLEGGNDKLKVGTDGITVGDTIEGGTGSDEIILTGADKLTHSEVEGITGIEVFTMTETGTFLEPTTEMLDTATGGLTINMTVGGNTVDMTDVHFTATSELTVKGSTGSDLVIADNDTINAKATLAFGSGVDTLRVVDGAIITFDDLVNVSGLERIELVADSSQPQDWDIQVPASSGVSSIYVDRNIQAGSTLTLAVTENVTVYANSNISVIPADAASALLLNVVSTLDFTENSDFLVGKSGDDLFTATSLDQLDTADLADGNAHVKGDRMRVDFAVNNINNSLENLFNDANISEIEILEFNPSNLYTKDVAFEANTTGNTSIGGDYDFHTFITSIGNDRISFEGATSVAYTAILGDGDDTVYDILLGQNGNTINFIGGNGNDNFVFESDAAWDKSDRYAPGEGNDIVTLNDASLASIAAGEIATLVTDGALEVVTVNSGNDIIVAVNNADLYDFTGGSAHFNLNASDDVFFNASVVTAATEAVEVTINAGNLGDILAVGGVGDDRFVILNGFANHNFSVDNAIDNGGIVGLRGADTIILEAGNGIEDDVVYKTAQDGGLEGQDGGLGVQDNIYNFVSGEDKIVFSVQTTDINNILNPFDDVAGSYVTAAETGSGFIGDNLEKGTQFAFPSGNIIQIQADAVTNASVINVDDVELAVYNTTALADDDLLSLATVAGYVSANTGLQNSNSGEVMVIAVQSTNDTGIYWFTDENGNADVDASELSLMGIVHDALLTVNDFTYA